ncbi:MAG TPA: 50S ribosomal protein L23 [Syntrophorhabdaceae bacterium]|jgi:large subunit ribosomal protein L23|nr:50S ribosomal protein L23 [Syntrophorhabdaceae bacterium]MDI9560673.1 50S ribosomal protein L23 [Pseudomonadota bacterium]OQC47034.1 MAG: 50S ribosomal protein L23 [Deltaproteobacteria bacterium ADurb.Bin026]MBV6506032.1 50S ribosomal protein L23 [Syntrophorhabdaceae bacterium]HNQ63868.1 50S ribosomal protein L23 [Syntrophorhabdaceae bacterium]
MNEYDIVLRPIITEKSSLVKESANHYVFEVHRDVNKIEIKKAIEKLFKVKVISVKTSVIDGKTRRVGKFSGKKPDWKKAVVKLSPKDKITIFEGA